MTDATYRTTWEAQTPPFGIQDLLRLAIWGTFAAAALGLAVVSINSGSAFRRPGAAPEASAPSAAEARRLSQAVNLLAADREQVLARLGALERGLSDVTGSIREAKSAAPAAPPAPGETAAIGSAQPPGTGEAVGAPDAANRSEANAAMPPRAAASGETAAPGLGVDVGGATNFEGLRTLWSSTKHHLPALPEELYPVVGLRENSKGSAELRLIIGPMASPEVAAQLCSKLAAAHHSCQPAAFQGQRLSLVEPAPKARAPAAGADPAPHHLAPGPRQP